MVEFIPLMINVLGTEIDLLQLLISITILAVGVVIARIIRITVLRFVSKHLPTQTEIVVKRIVYWGIIGVAALSAVSNMGIDFTGVLLAGGIFGIVIGFATQSIVANLISGLFLHIDRPVKVGDPIEVVDMNVAGVVVETTAFSTRLRRFDGVFIRIPNEKFFTSQLRNFSTNVARRVEVTVGIAYKEDAATTIQLIKEMVDKDPKVFVEPPPTIIVWELADSSVNINIRIWVASQEWFPVRLQIMQQLKELLDNSGIEIPFPHQTIWFGESKEGTKDILSIAVKEAQTEKEMKTAITTTKKTQGVVSAIRNDKEAAESSSNDSDVS
ncbi:MAG: mechanosensitive ion channel family protein [Thaumarchaeota archaeon]|nr:mechanosensitive ion channel family protein [Nitrososphaerota archaeon]